jgi:hypothetical protein
MLLIQNRFPGASFDQNQPVRHKQFESIHSMTDTFLPNWPGVGSSRLQDWNAECSRAHQVRGFARILPFFLSALYMRWLGGPVTLLQS